MTDEEQYGDIDLSDVIEDSEQFIVPEILDTSFPNPNQDCQLNNSVDNQLIVEKKSSVSKTEAIKSTRLPIARIKAIMKMDPDVHMINADAAFVVTKATELFLETLAKETHAYTANKKRKIITKKDLDNVINLVDCLCFLDGVLDTL